MSIILHIVRHQEWDAAISSGYYKPFSLKSDGFIHCSTIGQTADTANRFFPNQHGLALLCIDTNLLESEIRYEGPACDGDQRTESLFPHIYGPLNIFAVVRVVDFVPGADGTFVLPEEIDRFRKTKGTGKKV
jgi:uncharacterized protein (DUF952 family)